MKLDELVDYYDRELGYLRRSGAEFARKYPKIARRLELQGADGADPHVERLLEGFAFLTARIQRRLDDDFTELSQAMLSCLYPHYLAPVPSLCIAQFNADGTQSIPSSGQVIPRHTPVFSRPVAGTPSVFRTCYQVPLWPVRISSVRASSPRPELNPPPRARSALILDLETTDGLSWRDVPVPSLRFYVHGDDRSSHALHEYLLNHVDAVDFSGGGKQDTPLCRQEATDCLNPVGFDQDDGLLHYDSRSLQGHRLLLEYFAFPQKFLFFDLSGLDRVAPQVRERTLRVYLYSSVPIPSAIAHTNSDSLRLGCTPLVNLFKRSAEPITVTHTEHEYRVLPDRFRQNAMEVYQILSVRGLNEAARVRGTSIPYRPLYATAHRLGGKAEADACWVASRRQSTREGDQGTDMYLTLVNVNLERAETEAEYLIVETLCTNRDLPGQLPFGESSSDDFSLEGIPVGRIRCLTKPTPTRRRALRKSLHWRLISHVVTSLSSFLEPQHGCETLREALRLYDVQESRATQQQIDGILSLVSRPIAARVTGGSSMAGMARGVEIVLELDPENFVGSSAFLFASILERFFAQQVTVNSFTRLSAKLRGQEGYLHRWPLRAGEKNLV